VRSEFPGKNTAGQASSGTHFKTRAESAIRVTAVVHFTSLALLLLVGLVGKAMPEESEGNRLVPIDPSKVTVAGEIGRRIDLTVRNNVLALDVDRDFLQAFREKKCTAASTGTQKYIGLGKFIDALVSFGVYTKDPKVIALKNHVVDELLKTQLPDGYLGIFRPEYRIATLWDLHEMVYIIHGLVADYEHFGNKASLEAARKLADYIMQRRKSTDAPRKTGKLDTERAFIALGRATGENQYLDYGVGGMDLRQWRDPVEGHAYTFMNVCLAQLDLYNMAPDDKLLEQSRRVVDLLLAHDGLVASGTCSWKERFHGDQRVNGRLGETCATAYLIRLLHTMLCIEGNSTYGDIMERAVYNALFAAQLPGGRRLRYFTPLEGGRPVFKWDTYCCPNNFRRIVAELPSMIYYRSHGGGLTINLYTSSSAVAALEADLELALRQQTDYPSSGKVVIHLDPSQPARFPLKLRIPAWCKGATLSAGGQKVERPVMGGTFFVVDRVWKPGDRVELDMPMSWRLVRGRKSQKGRVAVLRGPMLFCLDPKQLVAMNPSLAKRINQLPGGQEGLKARQALLSKTVRGLRLDPRSLGRPLKDETVRPDGLACPARAWSPGTSTAVSPDLKLLLTEFADPGGKATYFLVPDVSTAVHDELTDLGK